MYWYVLVQKLVQIIKGESTMQIKDRVKELKRVRASDLIPNPKNWRTHPEEQQNALKGVLSEIGYADALLARETDEGLMLVDGHLRAETTPNSIVPVLVLDITEKESDLILATLDPLSAMAGRDENRLTELLSTVTSKNDTVNALLQTLADGYEPLTIPDPEPKDEDFDINDALDDAEEDDYEPTVQRGEVWSLGQHRLMCGDSTDETNVERMMAGGLAQLVVTDPPYGVAYDGTHLSPGTYFGEGQRKAERLVGDEGVSVYGKMFDLLSEITDDKASAFVFFAGAVGLPIYSAVDASQWEIRALIIWAKNHAQFGSMGSQYKTKHEPILYLFKKGRSTRWHGANNETTVWEYDRASRNEFHITQKPVDLFERPLSNHTEKGDIVFDGFVGSGTTIIAAERLDRRCYAMEIEPRYCDVAIKRWEDYTGEKATKSE
jgi:DNA modification methylase